MRHFILQRMWSHRRLAAAVILTGLGVSASEGLSIAIVVPLLNALAGPQSGALGNGKLALVGNFLQQMSLAEALRAIGILLIIVALARSVLQFLGNWLSYRLQTAIDNDLRLGVFEQLLSAGLAFIQGDRSGNHFAVLNSFTWHTSRLIQTLVSQVANVFVLVVYVLLMLAVSVQLTLAAAILLTGVSLTVTVLNRRGAVVGRQLTQVSAELIAVGMESLAGMKLIHLFGKEKDARAQFQASVNEFNLRVMQQGTLLSMTAATFAALTTCAIAGIIVVSTFVVPVTPAWIELLMLFLIIIFRLLGPATELNSARSTLATNLPDVQKVIAFLDEEGKHKVIDGPLIFEDFHTEVLLQNITFRYPGSEEVVLEDVTFALPRGQITALVGASGAGKSTIVDLLARFYDPDRGRISVDGVDLRQFNIASWRRCLGVVSQDIFLFAESVSWNIRYGNLSATDEQVRRAAHLAHAHEFIEQLPEGYDTQIGDRGVRLSGGQRQRIAIARAILNNPKVLILDEATSALDSITEKLVNAALQGLIQGRTVLWVAHRLSTIRQAHNIVVLERGQVVESGTHEDLVTQNGHYASLVMAQSLQPVR